jgi:hypothetical protein
VILSPSARPNPTIPRLHTIPEPFPSLLQFGLRELAVGDDRREVIAHLADDVDRKIQFFARGDVIDSGYAPVRDVGLFEPFKGFAQQFAVEQVLCAHGFGGGFAEFGSSIDDAFLWVSILMFHRADDRLVRSPLPLAGPLGQRLIGVQSLQIFEIGIVER